MPYVTVPSEAATPMDATPDHNLGFFLRGADMHVARAEGVSLLQRSHLLDRTVVAPIPSELETGA